MNLVTLFKIGGISLKSCSSHGGNLPDRPQPEEGSLVALVGPLLVVMTSTSLCVWQR